MYLLKITHNYSQLLTITHNYSHVLKNCSRITQKLLNIWNNDIAAALRVSVMQWRLEVILSTAQHKECSYGFLE